MRSTKLASKRKPTPAQITSAEPKPKTKPAFNPAPHRELTAVQAEIANEMAEIILRGGHKDDVELVLRGLMQHQNRRKSYNDSKTTAESAEYAEGFADKWWTTWFTKLAKHWPPPSNHPEQTKQVASSAPAEMVRANMRGELEDLFDEFIRDEESPEEVWLLREILQSVYSGFSLAHAFAFVLGGNSVYVSVPGRHVKLVEEYLQLLAK